MPADTLPDAGSPFEEAPNGAFARIRLTPKASRDAVLGTAACEDGTWELKVAVTAAPEKGKANAALVKLLAREWGVAKSAIEIRSGATDRRKRLFVAGDSALATHLKAWLSRLK